jgi:hypothetical protein
LTITTNSVSYILSIGLFFEFQPTPFGGVNKNARWAMCIDDLKNAKKECDSKSRKYDIKVFVCYIIYFIFLLVGIAGILLKLFGNHESCWRPFFFLFGLIPLPAYFFVRFLKNHSKIKDPYLKMRDTMRIELQEAEKNAFAKIPRTDEAKRALGDQTVITMFYDYIAARDAVDEFEAELRMIEKRV